MKEKTPPALVVLENNRAITTSKIVADKFKKDHKNVLRDIRFIEEQIGDRLKFEQMFSETKIADKYDREQPAYLMTRDGFALLAMGFTGKKALKFKLAFIEQFNRMEAALKEVAALRDAHWQETRLIGKRTRKALTNALKAAVDYFKALGTPYDPGYIYGHITNQIQNALGITKGGRDFATAKKLNQLDQAEEIAATVIWECIAEKIKSLGELDARIALKLRQLNKLLEGRLALPDNLGGVRD